jgi:hypothetical protein
MMCKPAKLTSGSSIQVLAEVLQQQTRLDDPTAAARKEYERCSLSGSVVLHKDLEQMPFSP